MANTNINFNNKTYFIDESSLSAATGELRSHLSTVMNGSGAAISLGGTSYNVDSAKLSSATNDFASYLRTIAGSGSKVVVNGVEYSIDSTKVQSAISELETTLGNLGGGSANPISSAYQEVEYIQLSGEQYIDTGVIGNDNTSIVVRTSLDDVTSEYGEIAGTRENTSKKQMGLNLGVNTSGNKIYWWGGANVPVQNRHSIKSNVIYTYEVSKHGWYLNNSLIYNNVKFDVPVPSTLKSSIYLGKINTSLLDSQLSTAPMKGKIYYCKIYESGTLLKHLVPCIRKADGTIGMYDLVNREFLENIGTGEFVAGQNVTRDVPKNTGVNNALLKAEELRTLSYQTLSSIVKSNLEGTPTVANGYENGVLYSSTRMNMGFVPNYVSLYTYLSSFKNPNAYVYTVNPYEDMNGYSNGKVYYGAVCSTYVAWCLGIDLYYVTEDYDIMPGMYKLPEQSIDALNLGDVIHYPGHVMLVTGIIRNENGSVLSIQISEAVTNPGITYTDMTREKFEASYGLNGSYKPNTYYRYEKINESQYQKYDEEDCNAIIIPRKGDKANHTVNENVVIDALSLDSYTTLQIFKDDSEYKTITAESVMTLENLPVGDYKACLTDGANMSGYCYWKVVDATCTHEFEGENDSSTKISFNNGDLNVATPIVVAWFDTTDSVRRMEKISSSEISAGYKTTDTSIDGSYYIRVGYKTDYGIIFSDIGNYLVPDAFLISEYENGSIDSANGYPTTQPNRVRTDFISLDAGTWDIYINNELSVGTINYYTGYRSTNWDSTIDKTSSTEGEWRKYTFTLNDVGHIRFPVLPSSGSSITNLTAADMSNYVVKIKKVS